MKNYFDVQGKHVVFTGGSGDLGKGMAAGLLEQGARVAVIDISDKLDDIVAEFRAKGWQAHAIRGDIGTPESLEKTFARAQGALDGRVDVLFNVAGIQIRHPSEKFPYKDWQQVIDINLTASFLLCQLAANNMIDRGEGGKIINIASMLSFFGGYTVPAYAASKGGIAQMTKALGNEWMRYNINVNAIAPGYMDTQMNVALVNDPNRNTEILNRIPAGRWGTAQDMVGTALFLASDASNYLSGAIIPVDGGYLSR